MKSARFLTGVVFLFAMAVFTVGCSDDDDNPVSPATGDMGTGAMFRAVHASPDAPAVDIYAEGVSIPLATNVAYGSATVYLDIAAGTYNIQLRAAGSGASTPPMYETGNLTIDDGDKITAIAMGLLGSTAPADRFRITPYLESFADYGVGNAAVRIVHASADAPTVGLDVGDDGTIEVASFERFAETGAAGVELPSGAALQVGIRVGSDRFTAFTMPALPSGGELFVIATGLTGKLPRENDGFSLLAVASSGSLGFIKQNPVVFALHGSPDAPAVDIFAGSTELYDNLSFGELSTAIQVPPGSYTLDFRAHDNGGVAASVDTPSLTAGQRYLAIASGFLSDTPAFTLLPYADIFDPSTTAASVQVVHASPDAPTVDVGTVAGGVVTAVPDYSGLAFANASKGGGTELPVAPLNLGIAATGTTTPVATFDVTTTSGLRAFAVATGALDAMKGESFRLIIVNTSVFPWTAAEVLPNP